MSGRPKTYENCDHALEKSTFKNCQDCFVQAKPENQFPKWIAKTTTGGKP